MAVDPWHRKRSAPKCWNVLERPRLDFGEHLRVDPDIDHAHAPALNPARQQQMRRFAPEERDRLGRLDRNAHHRTAGAVDAARQVNAENRGAIGVHRFDHLLRLPLHISIEASAKQRIDDQGRPADRLRIERQNGVFPAPRCRGRVARQDVAFAYQDDGNLPAARRQFGRSHKTVPAIIAAAGDHDDRPVLDEVHCDLGNGLACAHHQREARRTGCDGEAVGMLHLSGG